MLLKKREPIFGHVTDGYWCDIGDLGAYLRHIMMFWKKRLYRYGSRKEIKPGVFVGSGTIIDPGATINAPCLIGKNCQIEKRAVVDSFCIIGNNNVLEGISP